jgi:hypothetical protein
MFRMKSLRLGNFRSILELLGPDGQNDEEQAAPSGAAGAARPRQTHAFPDGLAGLPDGGREATYVPLERLARLYDETRPQEPPPDIARADDATVAAELRLTRVMTEEDLRRVRRSFAMRNHPDRVPDWLREEATRRMRIANALIDRAMREKRKKPLG